VVDTHRSTCVHLLPNEVFGDTLSSIHRPVRAEIDAFLLWLQGTVCSFAVQWNCRCPPCQSDGGALILFVNCFCTCTCQEREHFHVNTANALPSITASLLNENANALFPIISRGMNVNFRHNQRLRYSHIGYQVSGCIGIYKPTRVLTPLVLQARGTLMGGRRTGVPNHNVTFGLALLYLHFIQHPRSVVVTVVGGVKGEF
jgi:hypothetical protein